MAVAKVSKLFAELIKVALGNENALSKNPSVDEWYIIYNEASKQAISGILFEGVQKLPKGQWPPQELLFKWIGLFEQIRFKNEEIDRQTKTIWNKLKKDGLNAAVLKGQGIATLYGELASSRQSGDIDIWVKGGYKTVCDYVQKTIPTVDLAYHRFHYPFFEDTEVELHHRPTLMRNLLDDRKLARWYNSFSTESFVYLEDKGFAVPSYEFNVIFILTHIYRHFLFEGVGLRQVMDYYFVLKSDVRCKKVEVTKTLQSLKLDKFARAVMWVMKTQFGLEDKYLISEPDEKEGSFLLNEILLSGNFGQTDQRYRYRKWYKLHRFLSRSSHLLIHYPSEILWSPIWVVYHWFWKRSKKYKIHKRRSR